jgi:hypothetical protein
MASKIRIYNNPDCIRGEADINDKAGVRLRMVTLYGENSTFQRAR